MPASVLSPFAETIFKRTYAFNEREDWEGCAWRVARFVSGGSSRAAYEFFEKIVNRKFLPGGRYLFSAGRPLPQNTNCFLMRAHDSREGWAQLLYRTMNALSTGGGVGVNYSAIREKGRPIQRFGGVASGPVSVMAMVNEVARHVLAGGKRRSALWAGLSWQHPDVWDFVDAKDWDLLTQAAKHYDFNAVADLDQTNISICLDDAFFEALDRGDKRSWGLYFKAVRSMMETGEPGFSIDIGENAGEDLRNPCTEITSDRDYDCCNLASVNFARIDNLSELEDVTRLATRFLYYGTFVGWLPDDAFAEARKENRRLGLGLMGLHEWCLQRGIPYGPSDELRQWLEVWEAASEDEATRVARELDQVRPVKVRAIAPTGTIGILAETTTGIEPLYCAAYKRRWLGKDGRWQEQAVIDPVARRIIDQGGRPENIEDSVHLARDVERRLEMQAFVQKYVDQGISSTINLPAFGEPGNQDYVSFGKTLARYLPHLRGITVYPDGARSGQPIVPIPFEEAARELGVVTETEEDACKGGVCGI